MSLWLKDSEIHYCSQFAPLGNGLCGRSRQNRGRGAAQGRVRLCFEDDTLGEASFEKRRAHSKRGRDARIIKSRENARRSGFSLAGDLLNQCIGSSFGLRSLNMPFIGLYGACSTMALSLGLASMLVDCGAARVTVASTSSHFCSAERQFRLPLEYGGQRTPTSQRTATAAGASVVERRQSGKPAVDAVTIGRITDLGIKDANNMGAAMAPAAANTIADFLKDTSSSPSDFDMILTGDLGKVGSRLLCELLQKDRGIDIESVHADCGLLLYDAEKQDVHAGGSGCGCGASILNSYIMRRLESGELSRVLLSPRAR